MDLKLEKCKTALENQTKEEKIKIIWMWIKQSQITMKQFEELIPLI